MNDKRTPYVVYMARSVKSVAIDPRCQDDPFVRYKTPQLNVQAVGKGKMIRTMLLNVDKVAEALGVPPSYIPNYLGKSIGAQAKYDKKKSERERGSISGEYPLEELEEALLRFIETFVLCGECRYPELIYSPAKKKLSCQMPKLWLEN